MIGRFYRTDRLARRERGGFRGVQRVGEGRAVLDFFAELEVESLTKRIV